MRIGEKDLSDQAVLAEYEVLAANVEHLNDVIIALNTDVLVLGDKVRRLEKLFSVVHTVFRSSVYATMASLNNTTSDPRASVNRPGKESRGTNRPALTPRSAPRFR